MSDAFLEFRNVSKAFRGVQAVDSVSLSVPRGHVRALLGENGAGKSTLIKMLSGAYTTDSGEILLEDSRVDNQTPLRALRSGVVAIYQEFNLVPQLTVAQNIFLGQFPTRNGTVDRAELRRRSEAMLARLNARIDPDTPVSGLNVAEQQMVEIAKALSRELKVLVMDEPTAALNDAEISSLFETIRTLRREGVCIIYISHRISEIFELADSVSVLKDGRHVGTRDVKDVDRETLVRMMIGRDLEAYYPPPGEKFGEVVLSASGLRADGGLSVERLEIRSGEIVGVAGLEGQGQRELAKALSGALRLNMGEVRLEGRKVDLSSPRSAIASGIGFIPDDRKAEGLALVRSCVENIALSSLDQRRKARFFVDRRRERSFVDELVAMLQIKLAALWQPAADLSGGNQQKLVLAKALGIRPKVLIMAEPTRGVDVGAKREIYNIMRELAGRGVAILMTSGELPEILGMSDRILVMAHGTIVAELPAQGATEETIMTAATHEGRASDGLTAVPA